MPGGLPRVEQVFTAETSGYIAGVAAMIKANEDLLGSIAKVDAAIKALPDRKTIKLDVDAGGALAEIAALKAALDGLGDGRGGGGGNWGIFGPGGVAQIRDYNRMLDEYGRAMDEATAANDAFNASREQTERLSDEGRDALRSLSEEYRRYGETADQARIAQGMFRDGLIDQANSSTAAVVAMSEHEQAVARLAKTYGNAQEQFAKIDASKPLEYTLANVKALQDALASPGLQNLGGGYGPGWDTATAVAAMSAAGAGMAGAAGGGGRGRWTAAAYGAAGGGMNFPAGSAGADANVVIGFVKRWWTPVHFAIMTANELMATMLPAAAAAGAATLVGWQGVEQMIPRFQAINATAEALGGAYGVTSGSYLGTGSALQRYQNLATGGVYELGGAGINLARMGAGSFGQTGLTTIGMLDRGIANMQINMQNRGTMAELSALGGKGTDYLRQFGDIGANLGNIFLGLAPHLPGVGDDYVSLLEGLTGAAGGGIGFLNQHGLGNLLGAGMSFEAGWRVGKPVVGLAGRGLQGIGALLSRLGIGGRAGLTAADVGDVSALTGIDLGAGAVGLGGEGLAGALTSLGGGLGLLGGPEVAGLALSAFLGTKLVGSMSSSAQRQVAGLQAGIGQSGFSAAFHPLAQAIVTTTGLAGGTGGGLGAGLLGSNQSPGSFMRFGQIGPTSQEVYANAAHGFTQTMGDLINAGPQLVTALKQAGLKGVGMADAFQIAQNALLDLPHAFGKDGKLNQTAVQMLKNYTSAIGPMTQSAGGFNAAIAAQQIMAEPAMKDVSSINQALDSMTQVMTGGPLAIGGLAATRAGMNPQAMAKALTSFTSAAGTTAWNAFASSSSSQPGVITQSQQMMDQLRTYMTLGAMPLQGRSGAQGIAANELLQFLPMARQSPAALAMLMQQGAQMGVTGYYQGGAGNLAQNYQAAQKALESMAGSSKQINQGMTNAVIASSNLPKTAMQFTQGINANIQSQQIAQASKDIMTLKAGAGTFHIAGGALKDLTSQFQAQGLTMGHGLVSSIDAALKQAGVGGSMRKAIEFQVHLNVNAAQAKAAIDSATKDHQATIKAVADVAAAKSALASVTAGQHVVTFSSRLIKPNIPTLQGLVVYHAIIAGGGSAAQAALGQSNVGKLGGPGYQTGGLVPGSGSGDIIPAMLEPGEVVIPRNLVPLIAPILTAHRIPGFGGMPQSAASHFADGGIVPHVLGFRDPVDITGKAGQIAYTLVDGITKALSSAGAKKIADALVNKIGQEITLAKNVASAAMQGQGYGNAGIFGNMDVSAATGSGTVAQQMQSYLTSVQSFTKDIGLLRKGHLNKAIISQLIGAGPVQGDALAQSILQGYGGIGSVNSLWAQLGHATNRLGNQAELAQYGGLKASDAHVTININAGSGGAAALNLTTAQINQIVKQVQAALLKQARRNTKTGLQAAGKGA
jgi:hypothetical protein